MDSSGHDDDKGSCNSDEEGHEDENATERDCFIGQALKG